MSILEGMNLNFYQFIHNIRISFATKMGFLCKIGQTGIGRVNAASIDGIKFINFIAVCGTSLSNRQCYYCNG